LEVIWYPIEPVVDDRGVITHIGWTCFAYDGMASAEEKGRTAIGEPDPALLTEWLKGPLETLMDTGMSKEDAERVIKQRSLTWEDLSDPPGFIRAEWADREAHLKPWLFAALGPEKDAIEQRLIAAVRAKQGEQPPPATDPVKTLEALQSKIDTVRSDPPREAGSGGVEEGATNFDEEDEIVATINVRGVDYNITGRDTMLFTAALVRGLNQETSTIRLASGESLELTLADIEDIAAQLVGPMQ
jgi:hypothetical protein